MKKTFPRTMSLFAILSLAAACGGDDDGGGGGGSPDAGGGGGDVDGGGDGLEPKEDWTRDVVSTSIALDLTALTGRAEIRIAGSDSGGASFEIGDLVITSVSGPDGALEFRADNGQLDIGVPVTTLPFALTVNYEFQPHEQFDGWMPGAGVSFLWPTFCGNLYPCKSDPADGVLFSMEVSNGPEGLDLIYPESIPTEAPSYMPALAAADFTEIELGTTPGGVTVSVWHLPGQEEDAALGTANLLSVMTFLEQTYGAYPFGDRAGTVSADWGGGDYGGMEHHPFWHVSSGSLHSEEVNAHEAAHGWYGNGVRIACWEDFVLSEGTVTYMAARALAEEGV
ncbi:MAG TPA: M1 family aminopeptidase, partial [Kofleriaceae bacterium]|nr:M1 family aminopeptidase [Kofleriaceae bacterium]